MNFEFQLTTRALVGADTIDRIGNLATELAAKNVLLVTDEGLVSAGHVARAEASLKKAGVESFVFQDIEENPTTKHVEEGVRFAKSIGQIDLIIGLGGGSAMDCAKGINFLFTNGGKMEDYWGIGKATKPMLPSIGVPTTTGTGSEAQSFALISHAETHVKMACGDPKALFRRVILDPKLTMSAPKDVVAATGMDAVSHAVESHVTKKRTPFSQMLSREAWRLLERNFEKVLGKTYDVNAWGEMQLGAHYAGAAIENSMLGAAHACANPLTAKYGITHGVAVGVMLPHVVHFNSAVVNGAYNELSTLLNVSEHALDGTSAVKIAARLSELRKAAQMPENLQDLAVRKSDFSELAKAAAKQWTGTFNPRNLQEEDCLNLYESAW